LTVYLIARPIRRKIHNKFSSKYAGILAIGKLIGEMINIFKALKLWGKMYFIIASDHEYHLGCSVACKMGI